MLGFMYSIQILKYLDWEKWGYALGVVVQDDPCGECIHTCNAAGHLAHSHNFGCTSNSTRFSMNRHLAKHRLQIKTQG
jgi:hypothetical protein